MIRTKKIVVAAFTIFVLTAATGMPAYGAEDPPAWAYPVAIAAYLASEAR